MAERNELEKVYDPKAVEPGVRALWKESGAFRSKPDGSGHERTYTIVIPPPNVTGALHLGHALNNTLQDILIRYHRMRGFNTLWQPGTDHAGIATQAVVEKRILEQEEMTRHELGRDELVKRIWQWKDEYEKRIISQLELMGCSCDWDRIRFTLDEGLTKAVRQMFFKLFSDGLIFRGKRLVNWDTQLQTAVSDDEVYYETVKGHFYHFKYPVIDPKPGEPEHVIIATTRPETMLGDTAVAVHPDPEAFFAQRKRELEELSSRLSGRSSKEAVEVESKLKTLAARRESALENLVRLRDMAKDGRMLMLPLVERKIPLICDEWAKPELGSGCVKITPAHDPNDYEVGIRQDLPMINVLTADGMIAPITEPDETAAPTKPGSSENANSDRYAGLTFSGEGRAKVVADLEERGLLHEIEDHDTEIGHSDRSKLPIEPYLSDQWFIKTDDVSDPRASARADIRTPDLSQGATLLTWTTYGSWLPGDQRGFVSRVPSGDSSHIIHNLPGEPYDADQPSLSNESAKQMQGDPVLLTKERALALLSSIANASQRHGIELLAVAIMSNHVHVLCQSDCHGIELLQIIKGNASRELNKRFELGGASRWWTKSGSRRRIKSGSDLTAAIEYVKNQQHPLLVWAFDNESGESTDTVATARAEARGSGGIELPDGTKVPGLAQAAMDAVEDGRIRVFPSRYAKSYLDWLSEKRDWCISRQLWWGHRLPVWVWKIKRSQAFDKDPSESHEDALRRHEQKWEDGLSALFRECGIEDDIELHRSSQTEDGYYPWYSCLRTTRADECLKGLMQIPFHHTTGNLEIVKKEKAERDHFEDTFGPGALALLDALGTKVRVLGREDDVLDTWFSSALWPFSTLGWPDDTEHLKQYYPGSVLITSRDIITNWVARMVMFGLYAIGRIPFDHVYIHPKILDGRGETMSKSKGNGVDPVDTIDTHGADALRFAMADMTTETQDIRMPVEYVCPHCGKLTHQELALKAEEQARKSRGEKIVQKLQPVDCKRVKCANGDCGREFATQWAAGDLKEELGLGRETSDKFDIGRNFCNKLWNAARFAFLNLEGAPRDRLDVATLPPEDRWILARLSQTIRRYHECLENYQFSASIRELREFFWDCLCDWYIELTKPRISPEPRALAPPDSEGDPEPRASARADVNNEPDPQCAPRADLKTDNDPAKQVLAFCLDQILRLLHPTVPFITERLWQQLNHIAPVRGLPGVATPPTDVPLVLAEFPPVDGYPALEDDAILATFTELQDATRGVRELRAASGVSPKEKLTVTVVALEQHADSFNSHSHIVRHMANIGELHVVSQAKRPRNAASAAVGNLRIYVHDISDDDAERDRTTKALDQIEKQIAGKLKKLDNEKFVAGAPADVVDAERIRLAQLTDQQKGLLDHLAELKA